MVRFYSLLTLNKDRIMLKKTYVSNTYPELSSYMQESVYSEPQHAKFMSTLKSAFDLLIELCVNLPHQLKQIVYLAEDIVEIAKQIPSSINNNDVIDMRYQICDVVHEIANHAPKVEIGLPINIDNHIKTIRETNGY